MESLPAVLVGGPPHSGKSVLSYSLTLALRAAEVDHYLLRACPDGEGDWIYHIRHDTVRLLRVRSNWSQDWVDQTCAAIANRQVPLLVDTGGKIDAWQRAILSHCTHAILLAAAPADLAPWQTLAEETGTLLLARLQSSLTDPDELWSPGLPLEGRLHGLERGQTASGATFTALVGKLTALFAHGGPELRHLHLVAAPLDLWLDLEQMAQTMGSGERWSPTDLPRLLDQFEPGRALAVYGRGPNWLYGALAALTAPEPFYQFDPRLGWVAPPRLAFGPTDPEAARLIAGPTYQRLRVNLLDPYLDYAAAASLTFPPLPPGEALVIDGRLPLWLTTGLVRLYPSAPWLAIYQPPLHGAVVVKSAAPDIAVGQVIPLAALA